MDEKNIKKIDKLIVNLCNEIIKKDKMDNDECMAVAEMTKSLSVLIETRALLS